MSSEQGSGERFSKEGTRTPPLGTSNPDKSGERDTTQSKPSTPHQQQQQQQSEGHSQSKSVTPQSERTEVSQSAAVSAFVASDSNARAPLASTEGQEEDPPRQVIAVSASKGPAAFFNLARKFLATDEMCDLSALEGAIVSAVDAAHLLERSQLATIVRVNTSYVTVEPKKRKQPSQMTEQDEDPSQTQPIDSSSVSGSPLVASVTPAADVKPPAQPSPLPEQVSAHQTATSTSRSGRSSGGRELRRARIVITVRRTESYKRWLEENPLQAIIGTDDDSEVALEQTPGSRKQSE